MQVPKRQTMPIGHPAPASGAAPGMNALQAAVPRAMGRRGRTVGGQRALHAPRRRRVADRGRHRRALRLGGASRPAHERLLIADGCGGPAVRVGEARHTCVRGRVSADRPPGSRCCPGIARTVATSDRRSWRSPGNRWPRRSRRRRRSSCRRADLGRTPVQRRPCTPHGMYGYRDSRRASCPSTAHWIRTGRTRCSSSEGSRWSSPCLRRTARTRA
jgi:hypothetical protein